MSMEYCHHCDTYIDTDYHSDGEYTESGNDIDYKYDYKCENCLEEDNVEAI